MGTFEVQCAGRAHTITEGWVSEVIHGRRYTYRVGADTVSTVGEGDEAYLTVRAIENPRMMSDLGNFGPADYYRTREELEGAVGATAEALALLDDDERVRREEADHAHAEADERVWLRQQAPQDPGHRADRDLDGADYEADGEAAHEEAIAKAYGAYLAAHASADAASADYEERSEASVGDFEEVRDALDEARAGVADAATALLDLLGYGHAWVRVHVSNAYACGRESEATEVIAAPDSDPTEDNPWWPEVAFNATGDGHPCGASEDALYTVRITEAQHPDWVGASYEFG